MRDKYNQIFTGDCNDFMDSSVRTDSVNLVLTSPPYSDMRKYNGYVFDFERTAKNIYRVLNIGGVLVWVVGDKTTKGSETGDSFRQVLFFLSLGFKLHDPGALNSPTIEVAWTVWIEGNTSARYQPLDKPDMWYLF